MRKLILTTTALVSLSVGTVHAEVLVDKVVQDLQTLGYTSIEVYVGPTQFKVEGQQPGSKIEVIHDLATGAVLKQEIETLSLDETEDDLAPGIEIEDVAEDFLDSDGNEISDDEALNDPLANQVTADLQTRGYTSVETLIGPTQVRSKGYKTTGETIEVIYDRTTGAVVRETLGLGSPDDDDFAPSTLIEDVPFDFLDSDGNVIVPEDEDDVEEIEEEIEDELDDDDVAEDSEEDEPEVDDDAGDDGDTAGEDEEEDLNDGHNDDEALNDPLANQVTADLQTRGYTSVETLIGPTQVRSNGYKATGETIEVIYDRTTGAVIRETLGLGSPDDDDFVPGTLIEDVPFDFLDSDGNMIMPEDEDDIEEIEEIEIDDDVEDDLDEVEDDDHEDEDQDNGGDAEGETDSDDDGSDGDSGEAGGEDGGEGEGSDGGDGDSGED